MLWEYSNYHQKYILQNVKSQSPNKGNDFTQYYLFTNGYIIHMCHIQYRREQLYSCCSSAIVHIYRYISSKLYSMYFESILLGQ